MTAGVEPVTVTVVAAAAERTASGDRVSGDSGGSVRGDTGGTVSSDRVNSHSSAGVTAVAQLTQGQWLT